MSRYLLFTDPHLSDKPPSSCTDTYTDDMLALLDDISVLARLREAACIVCAGDFFHHKSPHRTSHRLVLAAARWVENAPCEVIIVPGNHDMQNDRAESLETSQPLGVLYKAGARRLEGWGSPFKLFGVPWLQGYGDYKGGKASDSGHRVAEALRPYREAKIKASEPYLVVTHAPLYPPGRELQWEHFPAEQWAEAMGMQGSVFYGHVHEPHGEYGFYDAYGGVTFCNNGALSRGSLHEYNLTRRPGVTWWDDQSGKFEFQELPNAKPASQVFRLKEKEQVTDMQGRLDEFLSRVSGASLQVLDLASVTDHVKSLQLGREAEDLIEELLEQAAHGGKK